MAVRGENTNRYSEPPEGRPSMASTMSEDEGNQKLARVAQTFASVACVMS